MIHKNACLAIIVVLLPFSFLNAVIGREKEKVGHKHYTKSGELSSRVVRDVIFGYDKSYLVSTMVAKSLRNEGSLDCGRYADKGRITRETFRKRYDVLKKHEATLRGLRIEGATNADIQKISELSNLEELVLEECQADDLSPLLKLKQLGLLSIHHPNMAQLRDEKLLQKMEWLSEVQLFYVPSIQEAINLPMPPVATNDTGEGLRRISIYAPTFGEKPVIIPEALKQLDLSFACGKKGYVRLSKQGIEARSCGDEASEELGDNLRKLVYDSGLMENHAIADKTRLQITGLHSVALDVSPLEAFPNLEHLTIFAGGKYTGFANLDNVLLKSILFDTDDWHGPSEENIKNLKLHPTLAVLEHNYYSASSHYPIHRLRGNAIPQDEKQELPEVEEVKADVARFPVVPIAVAVLVVFAGSFFYCRRHRQSPKQSDE